ncbi:MAG: alkaline phosphatase family protein [Bacteroidales bacterium]|nr:alkaline phosphatase family protein [Bacteroidales bacterium]
MVDLKKFSALLIGLVFFLSLSLLQAQQPAGIPSEQPKLILGIVFDQLRPDQVQKYWDKYGEDGFKKLMNNGTIVKSASYSYFNTAEASGYTTITTGTQPSGHGIVAHSWFEILNEKLVFCTDDPSVQPVGGSFENGPFSPSKMMVSGFADELKFSNQLQSKVFSIGLNYESSILSGGHSADAAYWFDDKSGNWMTSSYYLDSLPDWLNEFNEKKFADIYLERSWEPLYQAENYTIPPPELLKNDKNFHGKTNLPYDLDKLSKKGRNERDYSILKFTPFGNTLIVDMAVQLMVDEGLGKDTFTDYLAINFSTFGPVANTFGQESMEMEEVMVRMDLQLSHLLQSVENMLGKENVLVFMTSSRGMPKESTYFDELKLPVGLFKRNQALSLLKSYLNVKYGTGNWVRGFFGNQIYFNRLLVEDAGIPLDEIRDNVVNFMVQFTGVAHAITASTLYSAHFENNLFALVQNGYNPKRSGDVMVVLGPGWKMDDEGILGSGYNYDRKVPLVWYGWKIGKNVVYKNVDMADIAPTISLLLNIPLPDASFGKPIMELVE